MVVVDLAAERDHLRRKAEVFLGNMAVALSNQWLSATIEYTDLQGGQTTWPLNDVEFDNAVSLSDKDEAPQPLCPVFVTEMLELLSATPANRVRLVSQAPGQATVELVFDMFNPHMAIGDSLTIHLVGTQRHINELFAEGLPS